MASTPVFLPGGFQGWGSPLGCRPWGFTESDTTEATQQQQQQHTANVKIKQQRKLISGKTEFKGKTMSKGH